MCKLYKVNYVGTKTCIGDVSHYYFDTIEKTLDLQFNTLNYEEMRRQTGEFTLIIERENEYNDMVLQHIFTGYIYKGLQADENEEIFKITFKDYKKKIVTKEVKE